ncbi:uncharacterized protein N7496_009111 [Penicillium cataractarum]|uniref:SMP-30/Gluconolactonase/LRE-like region domain-containing protein n=1 Tax=Penicillium cataractarum TaxID=2100454 RepID=A0A9W9RZX6_9EURO|nr:uncharacterized protein N7496_009111 [Penicillium cataractarum]KAJ5369351.1 hypothetical protein N7496_009111 [Penicillium cataractarum]
MNLTGYCLLVALMPFVISRAQAVSADSSYQASTTLHDHISNLYQFSANGSFVDNIVLRHNGIVLVTRIDVPEVWSIDPRKGTAWLIFDFRGEDAGISSCFGITEVTKDVFTVVTGGFDVKTFSAVPGSFSVWKIDFTSQHHNETISDCQGTQRVPTVTRLVDIVEAKALGASTLFRSRVSSYLLLSESPRGIIWKLDLRTSRYSPALSEESMLPITGGPAMGVNGIKVFDRYLYYASVTKGQLRRIPLSETASATGPSELVINKSGVDNLDISQDGIVYLAASTENQVLKLTTEGKILEVFGAGNSTALAGPTCCVLDRRGSKVFIGTNGGQFAPVNGRFKEPAKVSVIQV